MNIGPNLWQCNSDEFSSFRCSSAQLSLLNPSLGYLLINLFIYSVQQYEVTYFQRDCKMNVLPSFLET